MANPDDEQFERYLKSFRPVTPPSLRAKGHFFKARRPFAVAAGVAACVAATVIVVLLLFHARDHALPSANGSLVTHKTTRLQASHSIATAKQTEVSIPVLTKLALDDRETFNALMTEKLQRQMPPMEGGESALRVLAKE
jgi:negative regulator of sigma E activity